MVITYIYSISLISDYFVNFFLYDGFNLVLINFFDIFVDFSLTPIFIIDMKIREEKIIFFFKFNALL